MTEWYVNWNKPPVQLKYDLLAFYYIQLIKERRIKLRKKAEADMKECDKEMAETLGEQ